MKGNKKVTFNIKIHTPKGVVYEIYVSRNGEFRYSGMDKALDVQQIHDKLVHMGEELTRKIAKYFGWKVKIGEQKLCESCAVSKSKQKNVPKKSKHKHSKKV